MNTETHELMDGRVHLYKRGKSRCWQASTYLDGRNHRVSTKEEKLALAIQVAKEWYMAVYVDSRRRGQGTRTNLILQAFGQDEGPAEARATHEKKTKKATGPTFREAADKFIAEYGVITEGQRNKQWTEMHKMRIRVHLMPFFGDKAISEINAGIFQEYRMHRVTQGHKGKKPGRSTLHHETVTMRLVLKTAQRHGWIQQVPDISAPYKTSGKVNHRAWFSPEEYKKFYEAPRERA